MTDQKQELVDGLMQKALQLSALSPGEVERSCWMVVHEYHHGMMPTEYDIRSIDEDLYLEVIAAARVRLEKDNSK